MSASVRDPTLPGIGFDLGRGCIALFVGGNGGGVWRRVERITIASSSWRVDFQSVFTQNDGAVVIYDEMTSTYAAGPGMSQTQLLRYVLTSPWLARDVNFAKVGVSFRDPNSRFFFDTICTLNRYEIAGPGGQLLKDVGDAACRGGIGVAVIDAFMWLRNLLVNPAAAVSPIYLVIGLAVGVLMYLVGWLLRVVYDRVCGHTDAFGYDKNGVED